MNITFFSICTARKKLAWLRVQSRDVARRRRACAAARAPPRRAANRSFSLQAHAGHLVVHAVELLRVLQVDQRQAGVVFVHADLEDARPRVNCFRRGRMPAGVTWPCGAISVTLSPTTHAERARQLAAEHDAELARLAASSRRAGLHVRCRCRPPCPRARAGCRARSRRAPRCRRRACPAPLT